MPMYWKFNDDIFARFLVIMKYVVISFTSATYAKWMIAGDTGGIAQWSHNLYTLEGTKQLGGIAWTSPRNGERTS